MALVQQGIFYFLIKRTWSGINCKLETFLFLRKEERKIARKKYVTPADQLFVIMPIHSYITWFIYLFLCHICKNCAMVLTVIAGGRKDFKIKELQILSNKTINPILTQWKMWGVWEWDGYQNTFSYVLLNVKKIKYFQKMSMNL